MGRIKLQFRPTGSAVFNSFDREYHELILADYIGVIDYAKKLWKAKSELLERDPPRKIGEPNYVHKFLSGLATKYKFSWPHLARHTAWYQPKPETEWQLLWLSPLMAVKKKNNG